MWIFPLLYNFRYIKPVFIVLFFHRAKWRLSCRWSIETLFITLEIKKIFIFHKLLLLFILVSPERDRKTFHTLLIRKLFALTTRESQNHVGPCNIKIINFVCKQLLIAIISKQTRILKVQTIQQQMNCDLNGDNIFV